MSNKHVPAALFDGVASSDEEARQLAFKINIERDKAKFAAMAKGGPMSVLMGTK